MYILEKGLSYPRLILVVQKKSDCSVFVGLNPLARTYPFTVFLTSLSLSLKNNCEGNPKTSIGDPLITPWNLGVLG
jgi:hypothetical protein